ncbi:AMP-binding protein [Marinobacter sp. ANT_B65]|uniref:AMP-binding protein n=1 Tax=Marinobacter sp. ANT_B65 TaxID=2039467 RepID=UPI000BBEA696|nr:AMP-binding protein [Marinobacter sp. ANT_B65]PCM44696.1 long-chain fatty acid--CoA ligase [Marinobacter sp. ANT_B65]
MTAALIFEDIRRSGSDIDLRGLKLAGGLTELGLNEGDVVAVMTRNHPAFMDIMVACRTIGIYHCAINWHFKAGEARHIMTDSDAKALIIQSEFLEEIESVIPEGIPVLVIDSHGGTHTNYEDWLSKQPVYSGPERSPRGMMPYTSGTTGNPKGVRRLPLDPSFLPLMRELAEKAWGVIPGARTLMPAPLYHSAPNNMTLQALLYGELLVLTQGFDAENILRLIEQHKITTVYLVPIMYVRLLRLPQEVKQRYDISSVTFVASTGSPCAPELKASMIEWWGAVIHETYASSETGMLTIQHPKDALNKPGSVGKPALGAEVKIINEEGNECPAGDVGVIYGRQPAYPDFTYQNNQPARDKAALGRLVTVGDMGYFDNDGYLYVCDRISDMVISGGVNIYPAEIENVLLELEGVQDCAVIGIPDQEYGESLVGLVKFHNPTSDTVAEIRTHLENRLAKYKVPRTINIVDSIARDDNGKISKKKIKQQFI